METSVRLLKQLIKEAIESAILSQIEELMSEPEFASLDAFIEYKLGEDDYEFNYMELQALARLRTMKVSRLKQISEPSHADIEFIRNELEGMGFKFMGRKPARQVRGFTSNPHGTHPFAGTGGGGSGFSQGGLKLGGGPGSIGGGTKWSASDPRNLPMGSRRR